MSQLAYFTDDDLIQDFLWMDCCCKISDKVKLGVVLKVCETLRVRKLRILFQLQASAFGVVISLVLSKSFPQHNFFLRNGMTSLSPPFTCSLICSGSSSNPPEQICGWRRAHAEEKGESLNTTHCGPLNCTYLANANRSPCFSSLWQPKLEAPEAGFQFTYNMQAVL